jgi:rhamnose utilization protein RhaD (predicted bifunctional aldolase and dehydrogenase)
MKMKAAITQYCATLGKDPLLVQGGGGNVSWKESSTLWIKASGMWLAEAEQKDIFVPVDLPHLQSALQTNHFSVTPQVVNDSSLKPSIETLFHALMPHPIVVHLHAVEVLAHLVQKGWKQKFLALLKPSLTWGSVPYHKPGAELAQAVKQALENSPDARIIFLENHGVIVGGESLEEITSILNDLYHALRTPPRATKSCDLSFIELEKGSLYSPITDPELHELATDPDLYQGVRSAWALYPDHVVFLGAQAYCYDSEEDFHKKTVLCQDKPSLVFIKNHGVYVTSSFNKAKQAQLRCYYDVLVRQDKNFSTLVTLTSAQIAELLNWDAEHYRMRLTSRQG